MAKRPTLTTRVNALEARVGNIEELLDDQNEIVSFQVSGLLAWDGDPNTEGNEYYMPEGFDLEGHAALNGAQVTDYAPLGGDRFECTRLVAEQLQAAGMGTILEA
jgi:hypothetical protein